jgi:hypothetical protein
MRSLSRSRRSLQCSRRKGMIVLTLVKRYAFYARNISGDERSELDVFFLWLCRHC